MCAKNSYAINSTFGGWGRGRVFVHMKHSVHVCSSCHLFDTIVSRLSKLMAIEDKWEESDR